MQLVFYLEHQTLTMERPQKIIASHSQNYLTAKFVPLSDDWSGVVTVLFGAYQVALDENWECVVPWEALQQEGWVEVSAFCGDLHTSIKERFYVMDSGYKPGQTPQPPTPSVYLLLTGMAQNALDTANDVKQRADSGEFNGKDGDPGPMGPEGPKGQDGTVSFDALSEDQRESLRGKSAYCYAQDGGFSGTEEEFASRLATKYLPVFDNAGFHNAVYRGKNLGSAVTPEQWAAIKAGRFDDMFIGDYWEINGVKWVIAAFDYYFLAGDTPCNNHHVTLVPASSLYTSSFNSSDITTGAYVNSYMYETGLNDAKTRINDAFGEQHILSHRKTLQNATTEGYASGFAFYDCTVTLMTEQNVFGSRIYGNIKNGTNISAESLIDCMQYPLFSLNPSILKGNSFWLQNVASETAFCCCIYDGRPMYFNASSGDFGVLPAFSIYQS